ncbi:acyltransferase family protein [Priestia megaterium]|uniref:acyltransferase family protein n=1 Tax=Priestia megaterium TaxID=1404 RepID=UPI0018A2C48F|nr:acyltransferase [Priestia megaterium]
MKPLSENRIEFLDTIRCIAALSVIVQHLGEKHFIWFAEFTTNYFQFGMFGVILFFLSSGFVIPVSLQNNNSLVKFWIKRIFRLYPLYIFSLVAALILIKLNLYREANFSLKEIVLQLTMLQKFLGIPLIIHSHWTLSLEMIFYILISVLFLMKLIKYSTILAVSSVIGALIISLQVDEGYGLVFYLATMFVGTVFYRYFKKEISFKTIAFTVILILSSVVLMAKVQLFGKYTTEEFGARNFLPVINAWIGAYILFILLFTFRKYKQLPSTLFLGKISYSMYLVQGLVIGSLPIIYNNTISVFISILLIIAISTVTYYSIENTGIKFGRRFSKLKILNKESIVPKQNHGGVI